MDITLNGKTSQEILYEILEGIYSFKSNEKLLITTNLNTLNQIGKIKDGNAEYIYNPKYRTLGKANVVIDEELPNNKIKILSLGEFATKQGFITKEEFEITEKLFEAWNLFLKLPRQHPDEIRDFTDGIHKCQGLIMERVARAAEPSIFPVKVVE